MEAGQGRIVLGKCRGGGKNMTDTKKELGQHWLHDETILDSIVSAAEVSAGERVLEIGPGLGTLTKKLADTGADVLALEFDRDLIKGLQKKFNTSQVKIVEGDIRSFDFRTLPAPYKVVANIPYYLTSHLIRSMSESENPPSVAVLLIQKEVAHRLCATAGDMSILAVTAQLYFDCSLSTEVPARYFTPPPKVDSQVVVMRHRDQLLFDVDPKKFFRVVKAGFSEKRKTLRNSLSGGLAISKTDAEAILRSAKIDEGLRAQALTLQQWHGLYMSVYP
jgi:16S rRNA (adenine1518-N6/adenine1519-N6)-dimethyltransferase